MLQIKFNFDKKNYTYLETENNSFGMIYKSRLNFLKN